MNEENRKEWLKMLQECFNCTQEQALLLLETGSVEPEQEKEPARAISRNKTGKNENLAQDTVQKTSTIQHTIQTKLAVKEKC